MRTRTGRVTVAASGTEEEGDEGAGRAKAVGALAVIPVAASAVFGAGWGTTLPPGTALPAVGTPAPPTAAPLLPATTTVQLGSTMLAQRSVHAGAVAGAGKGRPVGAAAEQQRSTETVGGAARAPGAEAGYGS